MANPSSVLSTEPFFATTGEGRKMMSFRKGKKIFSQGDESDSLFVIQEGTVLLSANMRSSKEGTIDILSAGDLVGHDSLAGEQARTASACALTNCTLLRIEANAMALALVQEAGVAKVMWGYVLARNLRYQDDLIDLRCNPSERRLARILLLLAHFENEGSPKAMIPKINQQTLAEMTGTTRPRVSFFLNKFKRLGFIKYVPTDHPMVVHRSLLSLLLPKTASPEIVMKAGTEVG